VSEDIVWIATYERVSSDDQRDRETIRTQTDVIDRFLAQYSNWRVYRRYRDDGVAGTTPMRQRPDGKDLVKDATQARFSKLLFTRSSRLGRDEIDLLQQYLLYSQLGIELVGVSEPVGDQTMFGFSAILNGASRRQFLAQSKEGMERAAKEGRYCGGIVPYGYVVEGKKQNARLVPSAVDAAGGLAEAQVIVRMYERVALDGWSCLRVARELNSLGVPTAYARDGRLVGPRGKRKERTRGLWTAQRVRNTLIQPVYKGELHYGRRSKLQREVIVAEAPPLVKTELWDAAQAVLKENRLMVKNTDRINVFRGVVRCGLCGRRYAASWSKRDGLRLRCNGSVAYKQMGTEKCCAASFRGSLLYPVVWGDVECWLRNPGDGLLEELAGERDPETVGVTWEAERATVLAALNQKRAEQDRLLDLYQAGNVKIPEVKQRLADVGDRISVLERQLEEQDASVPEGPQALDEDLLEELRRRLDGGLDDKKRNEILLLLAEVVMNTEIGEDGRKRLSATVTYNFPVDVDACRGRDSSRRRA
jgi:site-specific DNA recombinase